MEKVAEAAGISKVTLYNYFPSKEALFDSVATEPRIETFDLGIEGLAEAFTACARALFARDRRSIRARLCQAVC